MPAALALREEVLNAEHSPHPALRLVGSLPSSLLAVPDAALISAIAEMNARRLVRLGSIRRRELEETTQEFIADALARWPRFDARRSAAATFLTLVMRRRASSMVRAQRTAKRGGDRRAIPFDLATESIEDHSLHRDLDRSLLRFDVRTVVAGLPPHQRRLCGLLTRMSVSAAARKLRVPRHSLLRQLQQIRQRFVNAGMEDYG